MDDEQVTRVPASSSALPFNITNSWTHTDVKVPIPLTRHTYEFKAAAPKVAIPMAHRNLLKVIKSAYEDPSALQFHWKGFIQFWKPSDDELVVRSILDHTVRTRPSR